MILEVYHRRRHWVVCGQYHLDAVIRDDTTEYKMITLEPIQDYRHIQIIHRNENYLHKDSEPN